jgi:TonB family protein
MSAQVHRSAVLSGRPLALAITIALHVVLVSGLLAIKVVEELQKRVTPIQLSFPEKQKPTEPVERIRDPDLTNPTDVVVPPPAVVRVPVEEEVMTVVTEPDVVVVDPDQRPARAAITPDTPLRFQAVRPSDDYYPPQAIRMAQEGAAIVRACVDAGGRLASAPVVVTSSRSSLLDTAAVTWAREALRFTPATRAGVAVASCKDFRVNFTLH